jgi:hypothetical protein
MPAAGKIEVKMDRRFLMFSMPRGFESATAPNTSMIGRKFNCLCDTANRC